MVKEKWNKLPLPKIVFLTIIICFVVVVFVENFVSSGTYDILSLRCIDDVAFQSSLRKYHEARGFDLLCMNDYGYGWIFWAPMAFLTYPSSLLANATGVVWPLIVIPRMMSLLYAIGCSILAYKIIGSLTENEWLCSAIAIMMPLFPAGGYFAGRFGTVAQVAFFSMASLFVIIKEDELDNIILAKGLFFFAIAMGTKVSAIVMAPILTLIILNRYEWKFDKQHIILYIKQILLAMVEMLILMCPATVVFFFSPNKAISTLKNLLHYWKSNNASNPDGIIETYTNAMRMTYSKWIIFILFVLLLCLMILCFVKRKEQLRNRDIVSIGLGFFAGMFYLCIAIPTGAVYVFMYSTAISFVAPIGILLFDTIEFRGKIAFLNKVFSPMMMLLCITMLFMQIANGIENKSAYNILTYFQEREENKSMETTIRNLSMAIDSCGLDKVFTCVDYQGPTLVCNWYDTKNYEGTSQIWDNFSEDTRVIDGNVNVIVLYKKAVCFSEEKEFEAFIQDKSDDQRNQYIEDRNCRQTLVEHSEYRGDKWDLIYEDENVYAYLDRNVK